VNFNEKEVKRLQKSVDILDVVVPIVIAIALMMWGFLIPHIIQAFINAFQKG
jgi:hypothetical protein